MSESNLNNSGNGNYFYQSNNIYSTEKLGSNEPEKNNSDFNNLHIHIHAQSKNKSFPLATIALVSFFVAYIPNGKIESFNTFIQPILNLLAILSNF